LALKTAIFIDPSYDSPATNDLRANAYGAWKVVGARFCKLNGSKQPIELRKDAIMSTIPETVTPHSHLLGPARFAVTGALFMGVFYILCWAGAALGIVPVTHMYLQLFSDAPMPSTAMLVEGTIWSVLFGLLAGALIALIYNALGSLDRR